MSPRCAAAALVAAVAAMHLAAISAGAAQAACLSYVAPVSLSGRVLRRTYPGPPNYESIARGDRRETVAILRLAAPACVAADPADASGFSPALRRVTEVQLVGPLPGPGARPGARVQVSGRLFGAHTGHHHTAVLLGGVTLGRAASP